MAPHSPAAAASKVQVLLQVVVIARLICGKYAASTLCRRIVEIKIHAKPVVMTDAGPRQRRLISVPTPSSSRISAAAHARRGRR